MKSVINTRPRKIGLAVLIILLIGPFLIPVNTNGTKTHKEAAADFWNGESQWIEIEGHEIHYVSAGDPESERVIILLHGFGASAFSYKAVLPLIAEGSYVIAYDRTAFGFTERPTEWEMNPYGVPGQLEVLDQLIEKFGRGKEVVVVGHSAGGAIAAEYAINHSSKLDKLVLFAPAVLTSGGAPGWINWIFSIPQIDHLGPLLVSQIATAGLDILYSSYFDPNKVTDEVIAGYTAPLQIAGWEQAFWEFNRAPRGESISERLHEIEIPTLVITGDNDTIVPTSDSVRVSELISGSELVIIPRTGHLANEEMPEYFADAILDFVRNSD